ncbi:MAG TPA: HAD-IA family hydrolase [Chloroflexota bacterium]|nr:HAD-IA family hydrolase [Chloroflexota bacterium]
MSPPHNPPTDQGGTSIDCLLFDLDGTLIDTTDLIFQSYQHALGTLLGIQATAEDLYLGYGRPLPEAFAAILEWREVRRPPAEQAVLIEKLVAAYRAFNVAHHDELAREFPGTGAVLDELRRRGYPLGLVTSKSRGIAERGLRLARLAECFDTLVFMEDSTRHKPHPEPIWTALGRLGFQEQPQRALYVGDSIHDLRAGRAAGVRTAGALWGPFPPESLIAEGPDLLLSSLADLLQLCPGPSAPAPAPR